MRDALQTTAEHPLPIPRSPSPRKANDQHCRASRAMPRNHPRRLKVAGVETWLNMGRMGGVARAAPALPNSKPITHHPSSACWFGSTQRVLGIVAAAPWHSPQ